jgi:predicted lipoprotein with Yx(FWY)xxD motif
MKRLLIAAAVVAVVAVVVGVAIAATSGGGGGGGKGSSAPASNAGGATVSAEQISGSGKILVDSKGQALYANDQENGMALCDGACLSFWTPLTIQSGTPKGDSLNGKLGVVRRPDGDKQVTFNGKLLYTFYLDNPGKVGGDGFDDAFGGRTFTWHVVHANGATSSTGNGQPNNTIPGY